MLTVVFCLCADFVRSMHYDVGGTHAYTQRSVVCITNRRCHVFTAVHLNEAQECVPMIFISQDSTPTPRTNVKSKKIRKIPFRIRFSCLCGTECCMHNAHSQSPATASGLSEGFEPFHFCFLAIFSFDFSSSFLLRCGVLVYFSRLEWYAGQGAWARNNEQPELEKNCLISFRFVRGRIIICDYTAKEGRDWTKRRERERKREHLGSKHLSGAAMCVLQTRFTIAMRAQCAHTKHNIIYYMKNV